MQAHSETESDVSERKAIWKLERETAYMIEIEYAGDMYNRLDEEEPCAYFDMTIAINSLQSLGRKLSCNQNSQVANAPSLLTALPKEIH